MHIVRAAVGRELTAQPVRGVVREAAALGQGRKPKELRIPKRQAKPS
ncbi:hypothetical protein ACFQ0X_01235 [Streptomyces rectiviolaceus]